MADEILGEENWTVTGSDDYEEISSDEVDRVVAELEALAAGVESENIRYQLAVAALEIHKLVYDEEEAEAEAA